jgi:hypothetical protein
MAMRNGNKCLVSGGITTDICFYQLNESGLITNQFYHKVSYSNEKLAQYLNGYLIVNKHCSFEIWKIGYSEDNSKRAVELLIKY